MKQLDFLGASYNKIVDSHVIEQHQNFRRFYFNDEIQPTKKELSVANIQLKCVIAYSTPLKDLSQLSQMTGLIVLYLNDCDLRSTEAIRPLINLTELYLWNNKGVDITSLQFLTNLKILELRKCNLVSIDALRPLTKLESLDIAENSIVYVQPLTEHKQLSELNARYNQILDGNVIEQHHNFYKFQFTDQKKPTKKERSAANILRSINSPIVSLKSIQKQARSVKSQNNSFRLKVSESLQIQFNNFSQFVARASSLLQQMNQAVNEWQ
ncbi:leucine-rich_repeat domain-containing protein [Hexamita inflata]|uniref:Leucine-rich repeat domain-containing protein n=1 Tax=Hexamita inflata TaxID=28002 RepID=A0AA86PK93_9EUKA|nr:leucine-rich repeat domain-containing protein [Hexamita inflata]